MPDTCPWCGREERLADIEEVLALSSTWPHALGPSSRLWILDHAEDCPSLDLDT